MLIWLDIGQLNPNIKITNDGFGMGRIELAYLNFERKDALNDLKFISVF